MANTNAFSKWYVCATPQNSPLSLADYSALTWVEITGVGNVGETGKSTNVLTYNTWDTAVADKAKGVTESLKSTDPLRWIGLMNSFKSAAEEIVLQEVVYA